MDNEFKQTQSYCGKSYRVEDMLEIAKKSKVEYLDVRGLSTYYSLTDLPDPYYDLVDVANSMNVVNNSDLTNPIIIYRGFVMDGKHRLTKAIMLGKKKIKARIIETLPEPIANE